MIRGLAIGVAAVAAVATFWADAANAQSCRAIQGELAQIMGGGGGASRYEQAFREQAAVLNQTQRQARQAGCLGGGFLFFRATPQPICRSLVPKLSKMQANLAKLDRQRRRGGGAATASPRRIRMLQAMARDMGCGGSARRLEARRSVDQETVFESQPQQRGGTFRTLCVRTCDGYFFPVSYATSRSQFAADSQTCQSMCPGAAAELYYHANPGSGPEEMMSLGGTAYSQLPTAFQYKTSYNPSCTCSSKTGGDYALIQTPLPSSSPGEAEAASAAPRIPAPRPSPGEDPETIANLQGDFTPRFVSASSAGVLTSQATTGDRPVRVVGPAYWGAQEKEGVVLTPVPN